MSPNDKLDQNERDLIEMKVDLRRVDHLINKLDVAINKLTEVSTSVSQILAVQTNRLEVIEKAADLNSRRIDQIEKDLEADLSENRHELLDEIRILQTNIDTRFTKVDAKMAYVEKWMWWVSGVAAAVGFIFSKVYEKLF